MSDAQQPDPTTGPTPPVPPAPANPYAQQPANPYAQQPANPYAAAPAGFAQAPAGPSRLNVPGLISLILGSLAFLLGVTFGWIPFVGFLPITLALVGLVLGIVGLIVKNKGKGLAIAGTIVSGVALLISAIITVVMIAAFTSLRGYVDDYENLGPDEPSITQPDGGESEGGLGSLEQPAAIGDIVTFTDFSDADEWQVVVGEPALDATADVLAADEFNSPPVEGSQYVVVPLDYTYIGTETGYPYAGAMPEFVGNDGTVYPLTFAAYPESVFDAAELVPGGQAHANAVFEVPTAAVGGGLLKLTSLWGTSIHVAVS